LKKRVLDAVKTLDYHPSNIARSMRKQSSTIIGIIIPDINNPFFTAVVRGAEDISLDQKYQVFLCNSDRNPDKEKMYIKSMVMQRVSGAIIVPYEEANLQPLIKLGIPFVFVNHTLPGLQVDSVVLDNFKGAYEATKHLIELGHTRIGLINAPKQSSVQAQRSIGFQKALLDHGIDIDQEIIVSGEFNAEDAERATDQILAHPNPPTALFSLNNTMTIGTLKSITKHNLRIPADISIVGFDDMPWLSFFTPPITVVQQPTYDMGTQAAQLLFNHIENSETGEAKKLTLDPKLVIRNSTAAVAKVNKGF
jgi:DNA-binding LacI/PurR family transcriptional regulator